MRCSFSGWRRRSSSTLTRRSARSAPRIRYSSSDSPRPSTPSTGSACMSASAWWSPPWRSSRLRLARSTSAARCVALAGAPAGGGLSRAGRVGIRGQPRARRARHEHETARPLARPGARPGRASRRASPGPGSARATDAPRSPDSSSRLPSRRHRASCARASAACSATPRWRSAIRSRTAGSSTPTAGRRARQARSRRSSAGGETVALLSHRRGPARRPGARARRSRPPLAWRSRTSGCRRSCGRSSRSCGRRGRRVVAAGDAERRRLERDLHDGAQQRLVGLSLCARPARARLDGRAIAPQHRRGARPSSTPRSRAARGRPRALPRAARRGGPRRRPRGTDRGGAGRDRDRRSPDERLDAAVEAAAYFVVAESAQAQPRACARPRSRSDGRTGSWSRSKATSPTGRARRARGPRRRARRDARGRARGRPASEHPRGDPVRVVIADDEVLLREGLERLLAEAGFDVVGKVGTADELHRKVELARPGRRDRRHQDAAHPHRRGHRRRPGDPRVAPRDRRARPLAPPRVALRDAADRAAPRRRRLPAQGARLRPRPCSPTRSARLRDGECVVDPTIVARLVKRARPARQLDELTEREREVLALMAEGRSNKAICARALPQPEDRRGPCQAHLHEARHRRVRRRPPPRPRGARLPAFVRELTVREPRQPLVSVRAPSRMAAVARAA